MSYPTTKQELLTRIRERHAEMEQLLSALSPAEMRAPELDAGWSVQDSLAHIAAWEKLMLEWIPKYRRGEHVVRWAPGFEIDGDNWQAQMHRYNAYLFEQNKTRALDDVLDEFRETFLNIVETIESLSQDEIFDANYFPARDGSPLINLLVGDTYEHYDEHIGWIRAWRDKTA